MLQLLLLPPPTPLYTLPQPRTGVVLKVDEDAVLPPPRLALADDDCWVHLLPQLRLALLHGGKNVVANAAHGQAVHAGASAADRDDVQVLGACAKK